MFMHTRLWGTEKIMIVNTDLNNVNITTGCLAPDNATFFIAFSHVGLHPYNTSSVSKNWEFSFYILYHNVSCTKINQNKIISTQAIWKYVPLLRFLQTPDTYLYILYNSQLKLTLETV